MVPDSKHHLYILSIKRTYILITHVIIYIYFTWFMFLTLIFLYTTRVFLVSQDTLIMCTNEPTKQKWPCLSRFVYRITVHFHRASLPTESHTKFNLQLHLTTIILSDIKFKWYIMNMDLLNICKSFSELKYINIKNSVV